MSLLAVIDHSFAFVRSHSFLHFTFHFLSSHFYLFNVELAFAFFFQEVLFLLASYLYKNGKKRRNSVGTHNALSIIITREMKILREKRTRRENEKETKGREKMRDERGKGEVNEKSHIRLA